MTHSAGTSCGHGAGAEGTQRGGSVFWGHSLGEGGLDVPPPRQSQCAPSSRLQAIFGKLALPAGSRGWDLGTQWAVGLLPGLCPLTHLGLGHPILLWSPGGCQDVCVFSPQTKKCLLNTNCEFLKNRRKKLSFIISNIILSPFFKFK